MRPFTERLPEWRSKLRAKMFSLPRPFFCLFFSPPCNLNFLFSIDHRFCRRETATVSFSRPVRVEFQAEMVRSRLLFVPLEISTVLLFETQDSCSPSGPRPNRNSEGERRCVLALRHVCRRCRTAPRHMFTIRPHHAENRTFHSPS